MNLEDPNTLLHGESDAKLHTSRPEKSRCVDYFDLWLQCRAVFLGCLVRNSRPPGARACLTIRVLFAESLKLKNFDCYENPDSCTIFNGAAAFVCVVRLNRSQAGSWRMRC